MVIEKSLQRPISVDAHDKQFVQCVSPKFVENHLGRFESDNFHHLPPGSCEPLTHLSSIFSQNSVGTDDDKYSRNIEAILSTQNQHLLMANLNGKSIPVSMCSLRRCA
jgi:hypothetical protein